jgi:ABC-type sugar transport system substrate-binding protein
MGAIMRRSLVGAALAALAVGVVACGDDDEGSSASGGQGTTTTTTSSAAEVKFAGSVEDGLPVCYPEPKPRALTIGYANPTDSDEAVNAGARAMKLETEKLGGTFISIDAKRQPDAQISAIEQLVARKVDGIVVYPIDTRALRPALEKAKAAEIPVIGIDVVPDKTDPGPLYASQILFRRDYLAYLQAREAARILGEGATVGQMGFAIPVPTIEQSVARAKYWAQEFGLKVAGRANNPANDIAGGEKAMTELLSQHPDVEALLAYNDQSAIGAASATRAQGKSDLPLVGSGGSSTGFEAVRTGRIKATVSQQVVDVGRCAVDGVYDVVEGTQIPRTVVSTEPQVITKETIDSVPTWEQQLEQRYGKTR